MHHRRAVDGRDVLAECADDAHERALALDRRVRLLQAALVATVIIAVIAIIAAW